MSRNNVTKGGENKRISTAKAGSSDRTSRREANVPCPDGPPRVVGPRCRAAKSSRRLSVGRLADQKQSKAESITGSQVDEPTFFVVIICLDNCLVGLLGGLGPYPTVSPPSSLVSSVADSANLEAGFARQLFQTTPGKTTLTETTPGETTPSKKTPSEMTPSGPPPSVVSSGPPVGPINIESSREDLVQSSERETVEPSVTDGKRKKRSAPDSSASIDAQAGTGSDEPLRKKKKKEKKKRKKSTEGQSEPIRDAEGQELVVREGSSRDAATRAVVESSGSPNIPLEKRKKPSCGSDASASAAMTPSVVPPTTTGGGSATETPRIKFRDRVEFKYDGDTPLAFAPSECADEDQGFGTSASTFV
ncbi:hypothetical protein F2Q69_00021357 [Brassica cretica]|uniref:Uncharacterized protein n=1 Tax=Brassica cretica TaxID=69181 RepID=A0A8S9Q2W9_BRACR|nr:hypothetical protein F2Q69_00021357 [Brassica cretica]